jgi:N-hydroxyarylamine O-acetyltransferase
MSLKLHRYLRRINYTGPLSPTRNTLHNLHRHHVLAIPFENIDVQRGIVPNLSDDAIFEKIVKDERGGWCFEMNLLFAWVLKQIGIKADVIGARVGKKTEGAPINHIALIAHLDQPYLTDVGFGNGFLTPAPLVEGPFNDGRFEFKLVCHGNYWRFYNHRDNGSTYDFTGEPVSLEEIEVANRLLATTAESPFVQTLVCARLTDHGVVTLTNLALRILDQEHIIEETAPNAREFETMLRRFGLAIEPIDPLWNRVSNQQKNWLKRKLRGF